jgi:hypothetical protein
VTRAALTRVGDGRRRVRRTRSSGPVGPPPHGSVLPSEEGTVSRELLWARSGSGGHRDHLAAELPRARVLQSRHHVLQRHDAVERNAQATRVDEVGEVDR